MRSNDSWSTLRLDGRGPGVPSCSSPAPAWAPAGLLRRRPPRTSPRTPSPSSGPSARGRLPHRGDEHDRRQADRGGREQASLLDGPGLRAHRQGAATAIDADDTKAALKEVNKGREAIRAIRAMLPRTTVHTRTTAPDGKVIYEDESEVQDEPHPALRGDAARPDAGPDPGGPRERDGGRRRPRGRGGDDRHARSSPTSTRSRASWRGRPRPSRTTSRRTPPRSLAMALVRGIEVRLSKEDTELASARDAIWLARRSLEENNPAQALVNLAVARQRLRVYREVALAGPAAGGGPDAPRGRPAGGPAPPGGEPDGQPAPSGPARAHADRVVGQDQRMVQAASVIGTLRDRVPGPPPRRGPLAPSGVGRSGPRIRTRTGG